jgi:hypothetical protein
MSVSVFVAQKTETSNVLKEQVKGQGTQIMVEGGRVVAGWV